jgi:hypothetical protein
VHATVYLYFMHLPFVAAAVLKNEKVKILRRGMREKRHSGEKTISIFFSVLFKIFFNSREGKNFIYELNIRHERARALCTPLSGQKGREGERQNKKENQLNDFAVVI